MGKPVSDWFIVLDLLEEGDGPGERRDVEPLLRRLARGGILKLKADNRPDDLIERLQQRGYRVNARQWRNGKWDIEVLEPACPGIADLRELEAPEPMERVLVACSRLEAGRVYWARVPRVPVMLFPHLESRGLCWQVHEEADHSALLLVWRGP